MQLTSLDVKRLIDEDDWSSLEMRRQLPPEAAVARILAAFANRGGGVLIIGVDEQADIFGLSEAEAAFAKRRLIELTESLLPGKAVVDVAVVDGRNVVYAAVDPAPDWQGPVATARGAVYARDSADIVRLQPRDITIRDTTQTVAVFVAMSFREEEEPSLIDYWTAMCRAARATELPITLKRIDLKEGDFEISQAIMAELDRADVVIADFTLNSRNVYFELGYARAAKKRLIQTARKDTLLNFDVRNWRTIFYRNATELEAKLIPALKLAYQEVVESNASRNS